MDIIDVMLARALTPQGQTETYVAIANAAAEKAEKAEQDAEAAIATVNAAAEDIADTQAAVTKLLEDAQDALETAQQAQINTLDVEDVDAEIKRLNLGINVTEAAGANTINLLTTYPDNTGDSDTITKLYKLTGSNEDGAMTQKAITEALNNKADTSSLNVYVTTTDMNSALANKVDNSTLNNYATTTYVNNAIAAIPSGGGSGSGSNIYYGLDAAGHIIVVDENGNPIAGSITEESIIEALIKSGSYSAEGVVGIEIDYENKSCARVQEAYGKTLGSDFNKYAMYGGRMRCNVADNGTINAFYGDSGYKDDGSNGEVMVYQPKFYYQRVPTKTEVSPIGVVIRKETLLLSDRAMAGFKLHPLFKVGEVELDYALLPAYEGSISNNTLHSKAGAKPASNITIGNIDAAARAHGTGWSITNMQMESAIQMLQIVEFGTMNGQAALEKGICTISSIGNYNCSSLTGSTAALGNTSGAAASTTNEINGSTNNYSEAGKRAISYRGMENPWGNIWRMIGGMKIKGSNQNNAGIPFICANADYSDENAYQSAGFKLPSSYGWISAMGYGGKEMDWLYLPIECQNANSATPVGDNIWTSPSLNGEAVIAVGGSWGFEEVDGPFAYACDQAYDSSSQKSYSARLLYRDTVKGETYTSNITKWTAKMGG